MPKGWIAKGLLQPLWSRYEGGRDRLATQVGSTGSVLSSINTGNRRLGMDLATRLADELGVSVLELGAPVAQAPESDSIRVRLQELEETVVRLGDNQDRLLEELPRTREQLAELRRQIATLSTEIGALRFLPRRTRQT